MIPTRVLSFPIAAFVAATAQGAPVTAPSVVAQAPAPAPLQPGVAPPPPGYVPAPAASGTDPRLLARPPARPRESSEVKGVDEFYGMAGTSYSIFEEKRQEPGGGDEIGDARYTLGLNGLIGWGPVEFAKIAFYTHYKYDQNWGTDGSQIQRFSSSWMGNPKAETFIFPTKAMVRTHEFAGDVRFVDTDTFGGSFAYAVGTYFRLMVGRQGSSILGEKGGSEYTVRELAETVSMHENVAPFVLLQFQRTYKLQISMPFRTEINKEDPKLTNATYSWRSVGRGRLFSLLVNNELLLPRIQGILRFDLYYFAMKYSSLAEDRNKPGGSLVFDFPIWNRVRLATKGAYSKESFSLKRFRIASFKKGSGVEPLDNAREYERNDVSYSLGARAYFDINEARTHRISLDFSHTQVMSTIAEYNVSRTLWTFGYTWYLPSAVPVERRLGRFNEAMYAKEF